MLDINPHISGLFKKKKKAHGAVLCLLPSSLLPRMDTWGATGHLVATTVIKSVPKKVVCENGRYVCESNVQCQRKHTHKKFLRTKIWITQ